MINIDNTFDFNKIKQQLKLASHEEDIDPELIEKYKSGDLDLARTKYKEDYNNLLKFFGLNKKLSEQKVLEKISKATDLIVEKLATSKYPNIKNVAQRYSNPGYVYPTMVEVEADLSELYGLLNSAIKETKNFPTNSKEEKLIKQLYNLYQMSTQKLNDPNAWKFFIGYHNTLPTKLKILEEINLLDIEFTNKLVELKDSIDHSVYSNIWSQIKKTDQYQQLKAAEDEYKKFCEKMQLKDKVEKIDINDFLNLLEKIKLASISVVNLNIDNFLP